MTGWLRPTEFPSCSAAMAYSSRGFLFRRKAKTSPRSFGPIISRPSRPMPVRHDDLIVELSPEVIMLVAQVGRHRGVEHICAGGVAQELHDAQPCSCRSRRGLPG